MTVANRERTDPKESKENPFRKYLSTLCNVGVAVALTVGGAYYGKTSSVSAVQDFRYKPLTTTEIYNAAESDWAKNNPTSSTNPEVAKKLHEQHNDTFIATAKQANFLKAGKLSTLEVMSKGQKETPAMKSAINDLKEKVSQRKSDNISLQTLYENEKKESSLVGGLLGGLSGLLGALSLNKLNLTNRKRKSGKSFFDNQGGSGFGFDHREPDNHTTPTDKKPPKKLYKGNDEIYKLR